jgi:hypothetical protein
MLHLFAPTESCFRFPTTPWYAGIAANLAPE